MKLVGGKLRIAASDLSNYLACRHSTRLDTAAAQGLVAASTVKDVGFDALVERGEQHERAVVEAFTARGWEVYVVTETFDDLSQAREDTVRALANGADVVHQAALVHGQELGYPDFLVRADLLGRDEGYEVVDAKLARTAKARAVLQATFYSRLLGELTGLEPKWMHLALGDGELTSFKLPEFAAYERQVSRMMAEFTDTEVQFPPADTYPEPVEHCAICRWRVECSERRRSDDDLSLVTGIISRQRKPLKQLGVVTRRGFAALGELPALEGIGKVSLEKAHAQARIQVAGEDAGEPRYELVEPELAMGNSLPTAACLRCLSRSKGTCSSTSKAPASTPRTARSSDSSTSSVL